jgi:hypothetical protein
MWKLITNKDFTYLRCIDLAIVPRAIETHDMICMTVTQEEAILREVIAHELKVIYTDV